MLLRSNFPYSIPTLLVDLAISPTEVACHRFDRVALEMGQQVGYEFAMLRMSNLSPLTDPTGELCLLPSNRFMYDFGGV